MLEAAERAGASLCWYHDALGPTYPRIGGQRHLPGPLNRARYCAGGPWGSRGVAGHARAGRSPLARDGLSSTRVGRSGSHNERFGANVTFEGSPGLAIGTPRFTEVGINIQVLWPGQPNGYYHAEAGQEDFLVLRGECVLLIEGEERRLKAWDFVHCPPWTEHVFVATGDGPCVYVGVGARNVGEGIVYPVSELALRHGVGVTEEASTGEAAYASSPKTVPGPYPEGVLADE
jgi:uncharacterized cupin superfamily protein